MTEAYLSINLIGENTAHCDLGDRDKTLVLPEHRFSIPLEIKSDNLQDIIKGLRKLEHEKPGENVLIEVNTHGGDVGATTE